MSLQSIREQQGMTRRALAEQSGVNFRSIQDYEQGHKKLSSAGGDTLLRLAAALGCQIEELLWDVGEDESSELLPQNDVSVETILAQRFYCEKYQTYGRWLVGDGRICIYFVYGGDAPSHPVPRHDHGEVSDLGQAGRRPDNGGGLGRSDLAGEIQSFGGAGKSLEAPSATRALLRLRTEQNATDTAVVPIPGPPPSAFQAARAIFRPQTAGFRFTKSSGVSQTKPVKPGGGALR